MKTQKEIADILGISKQRVYRFIKANCISEALHEAGVMYYDEAAESLIIGHFSGQAASSEVLHEVVREAPNEVVNEAVMDTVIAMLQRELDMKNKQIDDLNTRLAESNAALVAAQQSAQAAQALHAGTIKHLADGDERVDASKGILARIFRRRSL